MKNEPTVSRPVRIVVIGAGNRANKYLEYARRYPDRLQPVAVVDVNDLRRHAFARISDCLPAGAMRITTTSSPMASKPTWC